MSDTSTGSLVELDDVCFGYSASDEVLSHVTLQIKAGDFVGVVGPSGSGKSTLLRAMSGLVKPSSGTVRRAPNLALGFVPQVEYVNWDFPVTVGQCVLMARHRGRRPWPTKAERSMLFDVLERLGIAQLEKRHIRALSGGQQQRMFIARALMAEANMLLLDEPTSGLDVRTRHDVLHLLDELRQDGLGVVLTTHDLNGIAAHLPTLVCLNGRVVAAGPTTDVLTSQVLEETYRSPMEVLYHAGLPVVVDGPLHRHRDDHRHDSGDLTHDHSHQAHDHSHHDHSDHDHGKRP